MIPPDAKITLVAPASMPNKVDAIKAIRNLTGLGLKEAKDAAEMAGHTQTLQVNVHYFNSQAQPTVLFEDQLRILRNQGFKVGPPIYELLNDLRRLGAEALEQGEDELANEILQLVLAEKLRRSNAGII